MYRLIVFEKEYFNRRDPVNKNDLPDYTTGARVFFDHPR